MRFRLPTPLFYLLIVLWGAAILLPLAQVSGAHYFPFRAKELTIAQAGTSPQMMHFLGPGCGCSRKILEYLERRGPAVDEEIHIVGSSPTWEQRLRTRGFRVVVTDEDTALEKFGLESVPQLLIQGAGRVLYQGAYNEDQRHNQDYHDLALWKELTETKNFDVARYPLFGCANGKLRKAQLDPWKMKYE